MPDVPVLVCTAGALRGSRVQVPEGGLDIGRAEENAVVIKDEGVSRYHARLLYDNGSLWLQDAGSRNGVFVNGVRVTGHQALKVGDEIAIADHTFAVRWDDETTADILRPHDGGGDETTEERRAGRRRWFWPFS